MRPTDESETSGKREEIGSNGPANHEHSGAVEGETEYYVESLKDHNGSAFAKNIIKTNDNSEIDKGMYAWAKMNGNVNIKQLL